LRGLRLVTAAWCHRRRGAVKEAERFYEGFRCGNVSLLLNPLFQGLCSDRIH
jgi:hypothetical protein